MTCGPDLLLDDAALRERYVAGDRAAAEVVLAHYAPIAARVIGGMLKDPVEAQDVLQQTLLVLLGARARYTGGPYVARVVLVAKHRAIDVLRKKKDAPQLALDDERTPITPALGAPAQEQATDLRDIQAFRDSLTQKERELLTLHFAEGLGREAIAERIKSTPKVVRGKLNSLLKRGRRWFGVGDPPIEPSPGEDG